MTAYQGTAPEVPQFPVVPVTTFTRPAVAKVPVVQPAAVPVTAYQGTAPEVPQFPVVPVTIFTGPAVAKVPVVQSAAVPVTTYQERVPEVLQSPVVRVTTFTRPAVAKVPVVQPAAVPVTAYQGTAPEVPQFPVVPVTIFTGPAVAKVPVVQSAAVPVTTYQERVPEVLQSPVVRVTTFTRPAVAKVHVVQSAAVPVTTYQETAPEGPKSPALPVTSFTGPPVAKVPVVQPAVIPITTFTRPAVARVPVVQPAAIPVKAYQQTIVENPETAAAPVYLAVTPLQQPVSVTPHVRRPTVTRISTVDTAPVTTSVEETPVVPAVSARTRLQAVSYQAPYTPVANPVVPAVNTYLSTPVPTVLPIQSNFAETGSARLATGAERQGPSFHRKPSISVATNGAAGISVPILASNIDTFGIVVNRHTAQVTPATVIRGNAFSSSHSYSTPATSVLTSGSVPLYSVPINSSSAYVSSTPAPSILIGSSTPIAPVLQSVTVNGHYSHSSPATAVFTGRAPSVTPVPVLQSHLSSGSFSAPAVVAGGAVSVNAAPTLRPTGESHSVPGSANTIPLTNMRITPRVEYSYPKPSIPFVTGIATTFRGVPLESGLEPAVLDRSIGLAAGLEIPSSTAGPTTIKSVPTRKPYTTRVGGTTFISPPTSHAEIVNIHENAYVPSSVTISPDIPISRSHTLNQKVLLSSTLEPVHSVLVDGRFGERIPNEDAESATPYPIAGGREKFIPQINFAYGVPPATAYTIGSSFIYDAGQSRRLGKPYSAQVSSTPFPATSAPEPGATFVSSTTRPVTYTTAGPPKSSLTVLPALKTTYVSSALPVASVTSPPVLQSTSSDYNYLEGYGLRVGQSASRRKQTSTTPISYENKNVEAILDKYSGILDNNKEGFVSEVIADDLAGRGRSRVSHGGTEDALQRGHVDSVSRSGLNGRYAANAGYSDEGSNTVFGTRTGYPATSTTNTGSSTLHSTADGTYVSTGASPSRGGLRGNIRYGSNVNIDADGGTGYEAITVEQEGTKSRSKEAPVVVITRLSDINPLLIAKLGAQCTCQSNTITLKRPDGYSRGEDSGSKLLPIPGPILQDDITSRGETYSVPEHTPSAPLPGSNIVTGTSPDIILGLKDGISPSTSVNLDPLSLAIPEANKFFKAIGVDEFGVTPAPTVLVTTFRPQSKLSEFTYTTAKPVKIASLLPSIADVRTHARPHVVSTPLVPLVKVSTDIPATVGATSSQRAQIPHLVSTTTAPIPVTGVPDFRRVALFPGGNSKTGCSDSSVEGAGSARGLDVKIDGRAPGATQRVGLGVGRSFDRYGPGGWRGLDETLQGSVDCKRAGLFRHPKYCNKFYACHWDEWKGRYTLHVFNCPVHLAYDSSLGACNWPSKGPACSDNTLLV